MKKSIDPLQELINKEKQKEKIALKKPMQKLEIMKSNPNKKITIKEQNNKLKKR